MSGCSSSSLAKELPNQVDHCFTEAAWYVIHTCCHHEFRVEERLRRLGVEVFLPHILEVRRWRDRKKTLHIPLFPGYLFIHNDLETNFQYYHILQLPGLVRILGEKGRPKPVPREVIDSIKLAVSSDRPYYPCPNLLKGKWVRVVEGPLAGVVGIIREHKEKKRKMVIEVELFRRSMAVELEDEEVELWHP